MRRADCAHDSFASKTLNAQRPTLNAQRSTQTPYPALSPKRNINLEFYETADCTLDPDVVCRVVRVRGGRWACQIAGFGSYSIGGTPVNRHQWLTVAAPLIGAIAALMAATAIGLRCHRRWARSVFICIWPLIALYGLISGAVHTVPWSLAWRAVVDATVVGLIAAWVLYRHRPSVEYFRSIQTC